MQQPLASQRYQDLGLARGRPGYSEAWARHWAVAPSEERDQAFDKEWDLLDPIWENSEVKQTLL